MNYDTGWAKFYGYAKLFESYASAAKTTTFSVASGVDGWGVNFGVDVPAFGGTAKFGIGYGDFEGSHDAAMTMDT